MENFDIIIVGASIAGSSAAIHFATNGKKVLLLDSGTFPRDRLSTHFMWPRGVSYLNRLGVAETILRKTPSFRKMVVGIEGVLLTGQIPVTDLRQRFSALHGSDECVTDLYCGPRRLLLDQELISAAARAGADVRQHVAFSSVTEQEGAVTGIVARTRSGEKFQAKGRLVIGADGKNSLFAQAVKSAIYDRREDSTYAFFGYFSGIEQDGLLIKNRGRLGSAIFPTSDGTHLVLCYGPDVWWKAFSRSPHNNFMKTLSFCDEGLHDSVLKGQREQPFKGCGKMVAFQRENTGPGWALIGDAASFKDQVTAAGMTHALRDAELLFQCVNDALDNVNTLNEALELFRARRRKDYSDYFDFTCNVATLPVKSASYVDEIRAISQIQTETDAFLSVFSDTRTVINTWKKPEFELIPENLPGPIVPGYNAPLFGE